MLEHILNISGKMSGCLWERKGQGSKGDIFHDTFFVPLEFCAMCIYPSRKTNEENKKDQVVCFTDRTPPIPEQKLGSGRGGEKGKG